MNRSKQYSSEQLDQFGWRHYIYINQLLGDLSLRAEVATRFTPASKGVTLKTKSSDLGFEGAYHHYCGLRGGRQWCSVNEGIQDICRYPNDTLCQSYSMMYYTGNIASTDTKLTEQLQKRMVAMWRTILTDKVVREQIIFSVELGKRLNKTGLIAMCIEHGLLDDTSGKQAMKSPSQGGLSVKAIKAKLVEHGLPTVHYLMQDIPAKLRGPAIIKEIQRVLNEWESYGWRYFMQKPTRSKRR